MSSWTAMVPVKKKVDYAPDMINSWNKCKLNYTQNIYYYFSKIINNTINWGLAHVDTHIIVKIHDIVSQFVKSSHLY